MANYTYAGSFPGSPALNDTLEMNGVTYTYTSNNSWEVTSVPVNELPIADTTGIVKGSADATKIVRLEVDGLTTATTRVLTVQDSDGTIAYTSDITGTNSGTNTGDEVAATTTVSGTVELATDAEMTTGTDTTRAITPANAKVELDKKLPLAGGTMTGTLTTLSITETETTKTASFTPNLATEGTIFDVSGTITITMPSVAAGKSFTIIDSGSGTLSWAGTIKWSGGAAPSPSGITVYSFISNGDDWYGMQAGTGFAV